MLTGTPGRDVLCGLDGNDRITGRGGNDIIDAGAGKDVVDGDVGNDRIDGGAGTDSLYGQGGADLLSGGSGLDILQGGAGGDRVYGDAGDADLSGGAGGDYVDGGAGFNVCDQPGAVTDQQIRCVIDESKPVVEDIATVRPTVDVSAAAGSVRIEAHVIDDTGVRSVQIYNSARLVSGTSRDGIWAATIQVPRYITPGPRDVDVSVRDRVGRSTSATLTNAYTVLNTVSDQEMPVLQSMSLSTTAVDVRSVSRPITATIQVTDDLAGPTELALCPAHVFGSGEPNFRQADACVDMEQSSGTRTDSTWKATYVVAKGAPSGTWNFEVRISDAAGNAATDFWLGPDELAAIGPTHEPRYRAIPDGAGVFSVQGTAQDLNAPVLTSLNLNPSTVDTSTGAVEVTADIAATDIEGIPQAFLFITGYAGYPDNQTWIDTVDVAYVQSFQLVSGTPQDGVWRATFVVPGGTPDGSYFIQLGLHDSSYLESWVSPDAGALESHLLTPELAPTGNHLVVLNS